MDLFHSDIFVQTKPLIQILDEAKQEIPRVFAEEYYYHGDDQDITEAIKWFKKWFGSVSADPENLTKK